MKIKNILIYFLVLPAATAAFAAELAPQPTSRDNAVPEVADEIKRANEAFYRAWASRDIWAMGQVWAKDDYVSAVHPADSKIFRNWDNVRTSWRQSFGHNRDIKIHSYAGFVHAVGDVAWLVDSTRFEAFRTQTGQPILMDNVLTTKIFERRASRWLLVHYHAHLLGLSPSFEAEEHSYGHITRSRGDRAVQSADESFYEAWENRDLDLMSQVWAKHGYVSAVHIDHPRPFLGWENVWMSWKQIFTHSRDIKIHKGHSHTHVAGDVAWVIDSTRLEGLRTQTGQPILADNVLTTRIFEKHGKRWLLVHYHTHRGPAPHIPHS